MNESRATKLTHGIAMETIFAGCQLFYYYYYTIIGHFIQNVKKRETNSFLIKYIFSKAYIFIHFLFLEKKLIIISIFKGEAKLWREKKSPIWKAKKEKRKTRFLKVMQQMFVVVPSKTFAKFF